MDLMELLSGQFDNDKILEQLSKSTGADTGQVEKAVKLGLPTLMQAMGKNAQSSEGAASLAKALDSHKDDKTDDIGNFLKSVDKEDGSKILNHILGNKNKVVQNTIAKETGMKADQTSDLMSQLAPLLLGTLGKEKASKNVDSSGLSNMLASSLGDIGKNSNIMDTVNKLLDKDNDGSILDDVTNILGGFLKKK